MLKRTVVIGAAVAALAVSGARQAPASGVDDQPALKAGLAGQWQLNTAQSEDARAKMREAMGDRPGGGGRGGGMGGGRGGRGGGGWGRGPRGGGGGMGGMGGGMSRDGDRGGMSAMRSFFEPAERLTITQDGSEILIDDGVNPAVRLRPDGGATRTEGGAGEIKARWSGSELVAETKLRNGAKLTTAYMLDAEKHQLDVTSRMEGGRFREPLTVRRVYDAAAKE